MVISRLVVFQWTVKEFTKIYDATAQPLLYLSYLLLADVLIDAAFVISIGIVVPLSPLLSILAWNLINFSLVFLFQPFATAPYVFVTPVHPSINKHDAASVWAEDLTTYNFRACLRELKNFDGVHKYLSVVSILGLL